MKLENSNTLTTTPSRFPTVSIIVPIWNEQDTLTKTIESLLALNYPKDKYEIIIVDDGSTDNTWAVAQKFIDEKNISIFQKENGGKHTALNFGLTKSQSEMVGCLDADSYVDPDALKNIIIAFENNPEAMAVTPSVKIFKASNVIQLIQSIEYNWAIFIRKMLSYMDAIYVTPGPFSIFKREVFDKIGPYRKAHLTEDMELAMRMQVNHMKIINSQNAGVYTSGPKTVKTLYKQRVRWTHGFIKNVIDYRFILFKKEYGNLGMYILPMACLSIVATLFLGAITLSGVFTMVSAQILKLRTIGFQAPTFDFNIDWFFFNTELLAVISVLAFFGTLTIILISGKMAKGKIHFGLDAIYFLALYSFIAPLWLARAVYNAIFSVATSWR